MLAKIKAALSLQNYLSAPSLQAPGRTTKSVRVLGYEIILEGRGEYFAALPCGTFQEPLFDIFAGAVSRDAVCLDVGANIGLTTAVLANLAPEGRVLAVEPDSESSDLLQRNIVANHLSNVTVVHRLIGTHGARKVFLRNPTNPACSPSASESVARNVGLGELEPTIMECVSIDDLVAEHQLKRVDFIKIDCEGAELDILDGATDCFSRFRPTVVLEFNAHCLMNFARVNPPDALDRIMTIFPSVHHVAATPDGKGVLVSIEDRYRFMHDHLMKRGSRDDLLCAFPKCRRTNRAS